MSNTSEMEFQSVLANCDLFTQFLYIVQVNTTEFNQLFMTKYDNCVLFFRQ